jgi:16S rRNA (cytosine1402-N4)-methyltransferase
MVEEVIEVLNLSPGSIVVDGTIGEGGHAVSIAQRVNPGGLLIGIDKDKGCLEAAEERLTSTGVNFRLFQNSYAGIADVIKKLAVKYVDGVILDLGFSLRQIEASHRGFSFSKDEILDMRYDKQRGLPAHKWLDSVSSSEIEEVLKKYGQEFEYRRIAQAIIRHRKKEKIRTSMQLATLITRAKSKRTKRVHPATKTFQAIRIYINDELNELEKGLKNCLEVIKKDGRFAVLTYHSLEDRIVKNFFKKFSGKCSCPSDFPVCRCSAEKIRPRIEVLKSSGIRPSEDEIRDNPSARSAHLRGCRIVMTRNENG